MYLQMLKCTCRYYSLELVALSRSTVVHVWPLHGQKWWEPQWEPVKSFVSFAFAFIPSKGLVALFIHSMMMIYVYSFDSMMMIHSIDDDSIHSID